MKLTADELDAKIRAMLAAKFTGDIVLHCADGTIQSFDFKESGRIAATDKPHAYMSAFVLRK